MFRWLFFLRYPDGVSKDVGERWYLETHTQEAKRLSGLQRYLTWKTEKARVAPPWTTIERLNLWDRVTELAWNNPEDWYEGAIVNPPAFTEPSYGGRGFKAATIWIDEEGDDFLDGAGVASPPAEAVRWLFLLRYPDGVSLEDGESWYVGTHVQEAKQMRGLAGYRSWRAQLPPAEANARPSLWDRLTELTFSSMEAWEDGAVRQMPRWTPPPYGEPGFLSETTFIAANPEYDLLRETPRIG